MDTDRDEIRAIQFQLLDTTTAIVQIAGALSREPDSAALRLNLQSVVNRLGHIQDSLRELRGVTR